MINTVWTPFSKSSNWARQIIQVVYIMNPPIKKTMKVQHLILIQKLNHNSIHLTNPLKSTILN